MSNNNIQEFKSIRKTFKDYYQDPDYRAKHQAYMQTKVLCKECGTLTARANMAHHRKSKKHHYMVKLNRDNAEIIKKLKDQIADMQELAI